MRVITFVLAIVVLVSDKSLGAPDKSICNNIENVLQELGTAQDMTALSDKYPLWTTDKEYIDRCVVAQNALRTLRQVNSKCFESLTQQVMGAAWRTRADMYRNTCKPGTEEFKEAVAASKCIKENTFEQFRDAQKRVGLMAQIILQTKYPNDKAKVDRACCAVREAKVMITKAIIPKCSKYEEFVQTYMDSYLSQTLTLICPTGNNLKCENMLPINTDAATKLDSTFFIVPIIKAINPDKL